MLQRRKRIHLLGMASVLKDTAPILDLLATTSPQTITINRWKRFQNWLGELIDKIKKAF